MPKTPRSTRRTGPAAKRAAELRAFNEAEALRAAELAIEQPVWPPAADIPDPIVARETFDDPIEGPIEVPEGELARLAHEINSRLTIADTYNQKTNDHQLAVALQLKRVKEICGERKINFRTWAETNLPPTRSWQMIRKLARVGESENPQLALEEWRGGNRVRQARYQQRIASNVVQMPPAPVEPPYLASEGVTTADVAADVANEPQGKRKDRYEVSEIVSEALQDLTEPDDQRFVIEATLRSADKDVAKQAIEKVFGEGSLAA